MKRIYIFSYDPMSFGFNPQKLFDFLNSSGIFFNWRTPGLPGTVILVSEYNLQQVSDSLRTHMSGLPFMVTETNTASVSGWMPNNIWDFISNPPDPPVNDAVQTGPGGFLPPYLNK